MTDFDLTEDHLAVEKMVRDFARAEVAPHIQENDTKKQFDRSILPKMAELNILGICVPESYGGAGLDYISLGLACEELEYVDTSLRVILSVHVGLNSLTLLAWGTEDQKKRYLVPQAQGKKIATYGLTEPNAGSDAVGIQTTAIKSWDRYVLNGVKQWISLAQSRSLPGHRLDRSGEEEEPRPRRALRVHRRTRIQGFRERGHDP
jgi:glutaryl-CoA dehydrogenase (non-decarboxylating)